MNLVKVHVGVDVVRRRHDLHQAGGHVVRVGVAEGAGPLPPHGLVRVRHEDDEDGDGPLAVARRVEDQVERGVEVVGRLIETNVQRFSSNLSQDFEDDDLGNSPGWWVTTGRSKTTKIIP